MSMKVDGVMCVKATVYLDKYIYIRIMYICMYMYVCVYIFLFNVCILSAPVLKWNFARFYIILRPFTFQFILIKFSVSFIFISIFQVD